MADVLLYHHAQGLTRGVLAIAETLRAAGHAVTTPDLYSGRTFDDLDEGVTHARELGFDNLVQAGAQAAGEDFRGFVGGFSLGALPAQLLAQTRSCAGAMLFHGAVPPSEFGAGWPAGVPVQIHAMEHDPWFAEDIDAARDIVAASQEGELFLYPGSEHLFTDASLPAYDAAATEMVLERVLAFLGPPLKADP